MYNQILNKNLARRVMGIGPNCITDEEFDDAIKEEMSGDWAGYRLFATVFLIGGLLASIPSYIHRTIVHNDYNPLGIFLLDDCKINNAKKSNDHFYENISKPSLEQKCITRDK